MSMLGNLAAEIIQRSPFFKLVGKCQPRHFHKGATVAKHCFKLLRPGHGAVEYIENSVPENAIDLSQGALIAANKPLSPGEEAEWDKKLNQKFEAASRAIKALYRIMYPEAKGNFIEDFADAKRLDGQSAYRKHMVTLRIEKAEKAALSKGDDLKKAFTTATVPVILSVVDNTMGSYLRS
ncbi:hypothetical protein FRB94_013420 [Tulasnella sp. JGI-2019a]|nr:hypothetical protein FRB94_013420 [Tulasnella sp. JGI-2019a]